MYGTFHFYKKLYYVIMLFKLKLKCVSYYGNVLYKTHFTNHNNLYFIYNLTIIY